MAAQQKRAPSGPLKKPTAQVLANIGVPVKVHRLERDEDGALLTPPRRRVVEGKDQFEEQVVRLDAYTLGEIEERYGDIEGLQEALDAKPNRTMTEVYALMWDVSPRAIGVMFLDGKQDAYATALGAALMVANGVPAETALKVISQGLKVGEERSEALGKALDKALASDRLDELVKEASTPGKNGSGPGAKHDEPLTSSGV